MKFRRKKFFISILVLFFCASWASLYSHLQYNPSLRFKPKEPSKKKSEGLLDIIFRKSSWISEDDTKKQEEPTPTKTKKNQMQTQTAENIPTQYMETTTTMPSLVVSKEPVIPLPLDIDLYSTSSLIRAANLRARIYEENLQWANAADEFNNIQKKIPHDNENNLNRAEALEKTGDWIKANNIYNIVWNDTDVRRDHKERAYENIREMRKTRGNSVQMLYEKGGLVDEDIDRFGVKIRSFISPQTAVIIQGTTGRYSDNENPVVAPFSEQTDVYGVGVFHSLTPAWSVEAYINRFTRHLHNKTNINVKTDYRFARGGEMVLKYEKNTLWYEPVDAFIRNGLYDRYTLSVSKPLHRKWSINGDFTVSEYSLDWSRFLGREYAGNMFLEREIFRTPYGSSFPLRYASLSLGYSHSKSVQDNSTVAEVDLLDKSNVFSINGNMHFLFGGRAHLDLSGYIGEDTVRELQIKNADLYGGTAEFGADMNKNTSIFIRSSYATESSAKEQGGIDKKISAGINFFF